MTVEDLIVTGTSVRCPRCTALVVEDTTHEEAREDIRSARCTGCGARYADHRGWQTRIEREGRERQAAIRERVRCCRHCGEPLTPTDTGCRTIGMTADQPRCCQQCGYAFPGTVAPNRKYCEACRAVRMQAFLAARRAERARVRQPRDRARTWRQVLAAEVAAARAQAVHA